MSAESPFVVARARVEAVERVSPTFARITFGGDALADFGTPGAVLDQRIKLVFPGASGVLPDLPERADWYQAWLAVPEERRGSMRTYSIRDLVADESGTSVVIDFVLHLEPGLTGPAATWASTAAPGDELLVIGPRRGREGGGGIEYAPGGAREVLIPAILEHLGDLDVLAAVRIEDVESEDPLWETPRFSGLGEALTPTAPHSERYFWIAGESGVVTTLRRHLVNDLGVDRSQVAFMGYWRKGVAMRG